MGMYDEDKNQIFENAEIECARAHSAASGNTSVTYDVVSVFTLLLDRVYS